MKKIIFCSIFASVLSVLVYHVARTTFYSVSNEESFFLTCDYDKLISSATADILSSVKPGKSKTINQLNDEIHNKSLEIQAEIYNVSGGQPVLAPGATPILGLKLGKDITAEVALRRGIDLSQNLAYFIKTHPSQSSKAPSI